MISSRVLCVVALVLAVVANARSETIVDASNIEAEMEMISQFEAFTQKYNRVYESEEVRNFRYSVFRKNMERAARNNKMDGGSSVHGVTKFSDLTQEEFRSRFLGYKPPTGAAAEARMRQPVTRPRRIMDLEAATGFDWRDHNAVSPVKDQGQCGSCWAFSATEEVESMYAVKHGVTPPLLSVQQTVSCDQVDGGCDGGDTPTAFQYMIGAGVESEASYPYTSGGGSTGTCKYNKLNVVASVLSYSYATPPCNDTCLNQDETTLLNNLVATGPASICVDATNGWDTYTGGILSSLCPKSYSALNHCVQLVGYNTDSTGTKYWIVRNSWNTDWGQGGYIYLKYGINACGVADEATFVATA
jgi:cathepsin F